MSDTLTRSDGNAIVDFLLKNPDVCQSHPEILEALTISHGVDGSVSLLEKQIALLRDKNNEISEKLSQLIEIARTHENLSLSLHRIAVEIINQLASGGMTRSRLDSIKSIESVCKNLLEGELPDGHMLIHWFDSFVNQSDGLSVIPGKDQRIHGLIERLYKDNRPICGPFSKPERIVLFPKLMIQPQSAVVAPLMQVRTKERIGLLMLMSNDPNRYVAGKGTMFLVQLMGLIESGLSTE